MKGGWKMVRSMKWKGLFLVALMICFAASFIAKEEPAEAAAKVFKWRFQSHWPAASASYAPLKKFMEQDIRKLTDGQLFIEVYPAGTFVPTKICSMPGQRIRFRGVPGAPIG